LVKKEYLSVQRGEYSFPIQENERHII
jgi:hypothetical protein